MIKTTHQLQTVSFGVFWKRTPAGGSRQGLWICQEAAISKNCLGAPKSARTQLTLEVLHPGAPFFLYLLHEAALMGAADASWLRFFAICCGLEHLR